MLYENIRNLSEMEYLSNVLFKKVQEWTKIHRKDLDFNEDNWQELLQTEIALFPRMEMYDVDEKTQMGSIRMVEYAIMNKSEADLIPMDQLKDKLQWVKYFDVITK